MNKTGKFVISLDFELLWGVRDKRTKATYGQSILGVWEILPKILDAFAAHQIKATFATVGFLFADHKEELLRFVPPHKPLYTDRNLSPYNGHFDLMDEQAVIDRYHFAGSLLTLIQQYPHQEIATHTFSHYYCLEDGQTIADFKADLAAAIHIAKAKGVTIKSLVFPRNQFNEFYLKELQEAGITAYRGNEKAWFYRAASGGKETLVKRGCRWLDAYINISGHNCYEVVELKKQKPFNIPSSRFFRPYSPKLKWLEPLKLNRILRSMTFAAQQQKVYHLWWHPHNFGVHQEEHIQQLNKILGHYQWLQSTYGFESVTMGGMAEGFLGNS